MAYERIPKLQEFLDTLALFPDRNDRIQALISVGERFSAVDEGVAKRPFAEEHRVPACESEAFVWVSGDAASATPHFAVENPQGISAMALATILRESLEGEPATAYEDLSDQIVYDVFGRELSMGKQMGLTGMVGMTKALASRLTRD